MEVFIDKKDWIKIIDYARCSSDKWGTEIGGMAVTIQDKDGNWTIKDPVIMKQEVSAALCELDKSELAEYYSKMAMKYKDDTMRFCWWHSHAQMEAFWSGTDINTIDEFKDGDLSFALVVNVKEEYKCRVSVWKPVEMHQDVDLNILNYVEKYRIPKKINNEVEKLCSKPVSNWHNSGSHYSAFRNKYNKEQSSLFEIEKGNVFDRESENNIIEIAWGNLIEKVDDINTAFISGEIDYQKYSSKIKDMNRRLKNADMPLKVELIEQCNFDQLLHVFSWDLITCERGYESLDPSESFAELYGYNDSFNVKGNGVLHGEK